MYVAQYDVFQPAYTQAQVAVSDAKCILQGKI